MTEFQALAWIQDEGSVSQTKTLRWHIDYLLDCVEADLIQVFLFRSTERHEESLARHLAADPGAVFSRDQIIHDVWDENWWGSTKTLDVHVASLRKKVGAETIETVRGVGFRLADHDIDE